MRKISIIFGVLGLSAIASIYVLSLRQPVNTEAVEQTQASPSNSIEYREPIQPVERVAKTGGNFEVEPEPSSDSPLIADEVELQARHEELAAYIEEYNLYLHDPAKRKQIRAQAANAAESYKREVLAKVKSLRQ